ncbi:MAG TPA: DUF2171 domain-containing protein [Gemmataceae bacterium]|nr:DUF2171 domain-containing protein [Gemmataceae bacterium]
MGESNMGKAGEAIKAGAGCCGAAGTADIREHMDVIASCGKRVGVVDRVQGNAIKLTKKDSKDGQHHYVPLDWVARVDQQVHLTKNSEEVAEELHAEAVGS